MIFSLLVLFSAMTIHAQESITGIWNTGNQNTKIEVKENNGMYGGNIISSDNAKAKIGKQLIKDVKSKNGEWKGKIYSVKKEKWMDAIFKEKDDILFITVEAGFMSKTIEWTKG